jgi:hypothetical protein
MLADRWDSPNVYPDGDYVNPGLSTQGLGTDNYGIWDEANRRWGSVLRNGVGPPTELNIGYRFSRMYNFRPASIKIIHEGTDFLAVTHAGSDLNVFPFLSDTWYNLTWNEGKDIASYDLGTACPVGDTYYISSVLLSNTSQA